jgi:serine/threonine protein kinase
MSGVDVGGGRIATDPPGYVCVRPLGSGAVNRVFLARRLVDGSDVVLRIFDRTVVALRDRLRFQQEVGTLMALTDVPHVLPILDADVRPDGRAYLVTSYCVAGSLHDHVSSMGRLSAVEAGRVGVKLAGALGAIHHRGVIHRRITPSNVLIDDAGEPVLTDFGLVSLSVSGTFMPEPGREEMPFLAPEAYLPELMTPAADIFALGATLYALLAGIGGPLAPNLPWLSFAAEQLPDLPRVPWALMSVLRRTMAVDARERFADSIDLRAALLAAL